MAGILHIAKLFLQICDIFAIFVTGKIINGGWNTSSQ